jgi:hypothetical protein
MWLDALYRNGHTVEAAARTLEIPARTLWSYLAGERRPPADSWVKMCKHVNLDPEVIHDA